MTYQELLTELAVVQGFIEKFKYDPKHQEEVAELKEQEQYLIEQILEEESNAKYR